MKLWETGPEIVSMFPSLLDLLSDFTSNLQMTLQNPRVKLNRQKRKFNKIKSQRSLFGAKNRTQLLSIYLSIYIGTLLRHSLTIIQRFDFYWLRIKDEIKENKDRQKKYIIIHKIYKCRIKMRRKEKYVSNL